MEVISGPLCKRTMPCFILPEIWSFKEGIEKRVIRCLAIALRELYVLPGRLDEAVLAELEDARALREEADYRGSFSETAARQSIIAAQRFLGYADQLTTQG